ncbi:hypothetical protein [Rhizobium sp. EC-SD404]|uniref:hypothetical protein n=1 Tax=Rhizobium sp. EC-SD404 TaxID=2038389 RepID=UPI00125BBC7C|nr:hypothetical protein [Rhizobium sp. EC-SD404]VVT27390.1 membrane hypothetical protein [Rhizobium sp. EC-SD404]
MTAETPKQKAIRRAVVRERWRSIWLARVTALFVASLILLGLFDVDFLTASWMVSPYSWIAHFIIYFGIFVTLRRIVFAEERERVRRGGLSNDDWLPTAFRAKFNGPMKMGLYSIVCILLFGSQIPYTESYILHRIFPSTPETVQTIVYLHPVNQRMPGDVQVQMVTPYSTLTGFRSYLSRLDGIPTKQNVEVLISGERSIFGLAVESVELASR